MNHKEGDGEARTVLLGPRIGTGGRHLRNVVMNLWVP